MNKRDPGAREFLYHQIPEHYIWTRDQKWKKRNSHFNTLGRMYQVSPSAGDLFYLRILLTKVTGATSFLDLRNYKGIVHATYRVIHSISIFKNVI